MDLLGFLAVFGDSDLDGDGVWDSVEECIQDADADGICDIVDDCVPYDVNGDMAVTVVDLLGLLLVFGDSDSDGDGVWDSVDECSDQEACNFAQIPTAPCFYDGVDVNGNGLCDDEEVTGCTVPTACNYDEDATFYDGSCAELDACGVCGGDNSSCTGCTDTSACNYNEDATFDDGSCAELDACGICGGPDAIYECGCADIPEGDCDCDGNQLDALGVCGGDCTADADVDGICDDVDDCVGAYDECGICNGPGAIYECGCLDIAEGDCDCEGNQLDALGGCGGDCAADEDADGICDDVDDCVGELDECDICNGPGAIFECGCADIPEGDCDCDGNQLDALGVCGGDCTADADVDGICDDLDDCVGAYDECGICNGPGAIYECGCADIPEGDCDCDGNQLDALGACGGDCTADADADGICDDVDDCVGAYDECGICNGPGAIYECGCADIPEGDCDCDGNKLDAIDVCGGDCSADVDADGICDDVDDCVGAYDECDICNGPGAIYECGCNDIPAGDCDCDGNQLDALGVCGGQCTADADVDGTCDDVDDCVGAYDECDICNGPGAIYECGCNDIPEGDCDCDGNQLDALGVCGGECTADADADGICDDVDDCVGAYDECGICNGPGAIYECGCLDIAEGDCDCEGNQLDALGVCGGDCTTDADADGICDDVDDCVGAYDECGICNGPGAIYECGCADIPEGDCDCDGNQLDALGVCGGDCAADEDADNICDDADECVGEFDACGVCNGLGEVYECGCADIPDGECDCDGNLLDAVGICGGTCAADEDADGLCDDVDECSDTEACNYDSASNEPCTYNDAVGECGGTCSFDGDNDGICDFESCGLPLTYQGYDYATVEINGRCWFAENLRSEKYANSQSISSGLDAETWSSTSEGALATYGETSQCTGNAPGLDACDASQSLQVYGRLYNWHAVTDSRELCPTGWHVPTDLEWDALIKDGGFEFASDELKSTYGWEDEGNGTNASGFNGLPAGARFDDIGNFAFAGQFGGWWSSSQLEDSGATENAWARFLSSTSNVVTRDYRSKNDGWSVRCVQDAN